MIHHKTTSHIIILISLFQIFSFAKAFSQQTDYTAKVNRFIGTDGGGSIAPVASLPFGMMQLGADTRRSGTGYTYKDKYIFGFSHLHKSGGGCADFQDILFLPLSSSIKTDTISQIPTCQYKSAMDHNSESSTPGYYKVGLYNNEIEVELTATRRVGLQRYNYKKDDKMSVLVDLEFGSNCACTIQSEHNVDTVYSSYIEQVDDYTIKGFRKSNGWAHHQQIYFYSTFSHPIRNARFFIDNLKCDERKSLNGENVKLLLTFDGENSKTLEVKTAISGVDMDGAYKNWISEVKETGFDQAHNNALKSWNNILSQIEIKSQDKKKEEIFYTALHNMVQYPMLFSDADYRFRGPDDNVHKTNGFDYYGAVMGLWDTFRAACPLEAVLHPNVMLDYVKTALEHFKYAGQLPIWTLAGKETYQMIGLHSIPMITNCYMNGITGFNTSFALKAMVQSATKDTCGYSMGYFVGLKNYKKYGYIPFNLEMESVARTLEYAYDDEALARFASLIGNKEIATHYFARGKNYKNVIDANVLFARGKDSNGNWHSPFNPLRSEHRKDDYCEGNAWQWTFFVPHDINGLAKIMGNKKKLETRLDSLFTISSKLQGKNVSGDISGLIGQYAHGNEPGHHTIYMYNKVGAAHKTQKYVHQVINTLYDNTPKGICGNEDTGQMSAWYLFSSLGFYPLDPTSGQYELGTPSFEEAKINLPSGKKFIIKAINLKKGEYLVNRIRLNGKIIKRTYITFNELLNGGELVFEMK